MTVQVQSQGLSLLTPKVTVYAANGTTVLGTTSGLNQYGTTLDVKIPGVTAGTKYYVKVQGADTTAFSTGDYALALNFGTGTTPVEASPIVAVPDGNPLTGGGGVADDAAAGNSYLDSVPVITGITPDNGTSSSDNITNTPSIALVGSAPAGNVVQVYLQTSNGLQYAGATQAINQNQWSWTYTGTPLTSGDYTFYAAAVDNDSGIQSNLSSPGQVIIDTSLPSAPVVSVNNPATGAPLVFSNVTTPVVAGTAGANDAISVYVDGQLVVAQSGAAYSTSASSTGSWSFTLPNALSSGVHTVTATAMTVAGTTGPASTPYTFLVTSSAVNTPVILGIAPASALAPTVFSNVVNTNTISIGGLADANATVNLYQSSGGSNPIFLGSVVANNTGHWLYNDGSAPLNAGTYSFSANEVVAAGASPTSQGFSATIDLSTPATPVISGLQAASAPGNGMPPVAPPARTLLGTAPAGDTVNVFLNGQQVGSTTANAQGNWSFNFAGLTLQSGSNNAFTVQAVDEGGNVSALSQAFNVTGFTAPASPTVTALSPAYSGYSTGLTNSPNAGNLAACYTNSLTPTISGTAPANSYVKLFNNTTYVGYTTANSSGNWSFTTPSLQNALYNFTAVAITANGVASANSNPTRFIVSTQPPNPPTIQTITSSGQQIVLTGTADPGTTINVYVGGSGSSLGTLVGTAKVNSSGSWTFAYTSRALLGIYSFQVTETNLAGNTSQASQKLDITLNLLILHLSLGL